MRSLRSLSELRQTVVDMVESSADVAIRDVLNDLQDDLLSAIERFTVDLVGQGKPPITIKNLESGLVLDGAISNMKSSSCQS